MQSEFALHELAVEDARQGHQRPKIEEYGQSLFVVLHMIEVAGDELNVGEVDIFVGRNYVLSVRSRAERGFVDVRALAKGSPNSSNMVPPTCLCSHGCRGGSLFSAPGFSRNTIGSVEERIFADQAVRANIERFTS